MSRLILPSAKKKSLEVLEVAISFGAARDLDPLKCSIHDLKQNLNCCSLAVNKAAILSFAYYSLGWRQTTDELP